MRIKRLRIEMRMKIIGIQIHRIETRIKTLSIKTQNKNSQNRYENKNTWYKNLK